VNSLHPSAAGSARTLAPGLATLRELGVIPHARSRLEATLHGTGKALRASVMTEVPAFSTSGNPEILPDLGSHIDDHLHELCRLFGGGAVEDFAFLRAHARRRAEQRFPLDASLHAYRCAHRTLAQWLRDAALATTPRNVERTVSAVADFAIEYTNAVSAIITAEYIAHTRAMADAESDRRSELLNILLGGYDESDGRAGRLLKREGYLAQRQTYCVAVAQPANPTEMEMPERAGRIAAAITDCLSNTAVRPLIGVRSNVVVAVLSDIRRQSGWTAPQTALAERLRTLLLGLGPAVIVGLSTDQPSTAFIPKALQEAMIALDFARVDRRVVQFRDLPVRKLLLHRAGDFVISVAPGWIAALGDADGSAKGCLIATLRALADADLNVQKAGRALGLHPNTIYARLDRIRALTGLDGRRLHDLVELLLAVDCTRT
jgi:hypothetical protein